MAASTVRGRFVWHELLTTDTTSAATFFSKVARWKAQPWEGEASYTVFLNGKRQRAGLMELPEAARSMGAPPNWMSYIGTPDVDETVRAAKALGAAVLKEPDDIPDVGRFAVLQDPFGAVFGVYAPNQPAREDTTPEVGDFSWHELATTDWRAALTFYQRLFGWEETGSMEGPGVGTYQMFGWNGRPMGGVFNKPAQMPGPPAWLPYIKVADAKGVAALVGTLGGRIINGPMEVPGGDWIAQGLDLQGAVFAVHSAAPKAAAATAAPKAAAPKRGASVPVKKTAVKKSAKSTKKGAVKKGAARKSAVKKTAVKKTAPKKTAAKTRVRRGAARRGGALKRRRR